MTGSGRLATGVRGDEMLLASALIFVWPLPIPRRLRGPFSSSREEAVLEVGAHAKAEPRSDAAAQDEPGRAVGHKR